MKLNSSNAPPPWTAGAQKSISRGPSLGNSLAATGAKIIIASASGIRRAPLSDADIPCTSWKNCGM